MRTGYVHFSDRHFVDLSTISFNMFEFNFFTIANSLSASRKCSLKEGLPMSELNLTWSLAKVIHQHNMLTFEIIYNAIMVYWAPSFMKGLESGNGCPMKKVSKASSPSNGWLDGRQKVIISSSPSKA